MHDRLVELIQQADAICSGRKQCEGCAGFGKGADCVDHHIADYLIENGVIVPPCKVGDTVYMISPGGKIHENPVIGISVHGGEPQRLGFLCPHALVFREDHIGETVFITREEAEQALKGEHDG